MAGLSIAGTREQTVGMDCHMTLSSAPRRFTTGRKGCTLFGEKCNMQHLLSRSLRDIMLIISVERDSASKTICFRPLSTAISGSQCFTSSLLPLRREGLRWSVHQRWGEYSLCGWIILPHKHCPVSIRVGSFRRADDPPYPMSHDVVSPSCGLEGGAKFNFNLISRNDIGSILYFYSSLTI